jgi:DNA-binding NtrC family response regulator
LKRILIVDDNVHLAENLAEILGDCGFEAEAFARPQAALGAFAPGRYAAAILDIRMSGMDGVDLYRALRERDAALPAIAMTGYTHDDRLRDAVKAGMLATLAKPLDIAKLIARLTSVAEGRTALVVEDDAALAQNLAELLGERGFSPRVAHSCAEARRVIAAVPISVALVDWRLPDGDGVALVEDALAGTDCTSIVFTGFAPELGEARRRIEAARAHLFEKPLPIERLFAVLESAGGGRAGSK